MIYLNKFSFALHFTDINFLQPETEETGRFDPTFTFMFQFIKLSMPKFAKDVRNNHLARVKSGSSTTSITTTG